MATGGKSRGRSSKGTKLYHYTSRDGCSGIMHEGKIYPSTDRTRDAVLGEGVYLTKLPPWESDSKLISNNWDSGKKNVSERFLLNHMDKVDYSIEFNSKDLPGVKQYKGERDLAVYPGTIDLDKVPHEVHVRGTNIETAEQYGLL